VRFIAPQKQKIRERQRLSFALKPHSVSSTSLIAGGKVENPPIGGQLSSPLRVFSEVGAYERTSMLLRRHAQCGTSVKLYHSCFYRLL